MALSSQTGVHGVVVYNRTLSSHQVIRNWKQLFTKNPL